MQSRHSYRFNHDDEAHLYDSDVINEDNPIRTGYKALHQWVREKAPRDRDLLDLGCGTGNTILSLKGWKSLVGVDVSGKMLKIAAKKLADRENLSFHRQDLMAFLTSYTGHIDAVVSVYALHHLEQDEKHALFRLISEHAVNTMLFGDLMFKNKSGELWMRARYPGLCDDFDDEYFWNLEEESAVLEKLLFTVESKRFSDLSWGILAYRL